MAKLTELYETFCMFFNSNLCSKYEKILQHLGSLWPQLVFLYNLNIFPLSNQLLFLIFDLYLDFLVLQLFQHKNLNLQLYFHFLLHLSAT